MNVYEKLNEARIKFQEMGIKQNGKNDFAKYNYFELFDILPAVNKINRELKTTCVIRFEKELAYLDFIDCEKPEDKITFTSPMSSASLKGCHEVQNVGAVESYIKRYLYQNAFEIAECDCLDKTMNPNEKPQARPQQKPQPKSEPSDSALRLEQLLTQYSNSISPTVLNQCNEALNGGNEKDIEGMLSRLFAYLEKKGIRL